MGEYVDNPGSDLLRSLKNIICVLLPSFIFSLFGFVRKYCFNFNRLLSLKGFAYFVIV